MTRDELNEANSRSVGTASNGGIRKTAIFLSILDEKTAREMLARLEPTIARAVEAERKRVGELAPTEIETVVAEFLALNGGFSASGDENLASRGDGISEKRPPKDDGAISKRTGENDPPILTSANDAEISSGSNSGEFQALDAFEPENLANALRGERASTVAAVAARLSSKRRDATLKLLPPEIALGAARSAAVLGRPSVEIDAAQFLEDAVFNRALNDD